MDNRRLILFVALSFVLLLIWQAWQRDYGVPSAGMPSAGMQEPTPEAAAPAAGTTGTAEDIPRAPAAPTPEARAPEGLPTEGRIRVATDVLHVEIDLRGGDARRVELPAYPVTLEHPDVPYRLMDDQPPHVFVAQSGLLAASGSAPTHHARYRAERTEYRLAQGSDALRVPLTWEGPDGIKVTKVYVFRRGRYLVQVEHHVENGGTKEWRGRQYRQLQRAAAAAGDKPRFVYTYFGGAIYSPEEHYEKLKFEDMAEEPLRRAIKGGWAAMVQHYFLAAWVPEPAEINHYYTKVIDGRRYVLGLTSPEQVAPPGGAARFSTALYMGPKLQDQLANIAEGLELTVDYGYLTFLSKPLFWLLKLIHNITGNWGWAIVLLTLLIKLAFYKLSETSYRSMARMRKVQPRLMAIKERYGHDKQRMNQAMMELYKKEKINPLGGCLPILVQIPVFIALYWVLLESVELRQAPFLLWLKDLSTPDPYYVLPVLMGISMFLQQKLNPVPMDPVQQKIMMALPLIFTVFFAFFPAGLVLYWLVNNVLSIAQQWVITRRIEKAVR